MRRAAILALALSIPLVARAGKRTAPGLPSSAPAIPKAVPWRAPVPESVRLPSGARVVVLPRHELPLVHIMVLARAGSAQDPTERPGLASATATMLEEGGAGKRTGSEVAQAFEDLGAELHVEVERDGVALDLAVLTKNLEPALALLGDVLARPRFDGEEWSRVRSRRVAEILHHRDEPRFIADVVFDRALFGDRHPYGAPKLGTPATVEKISVDELKKFYADHYGPKNTSVLLVGDVGMERARRLVDGALAGWSSAAAPPPPPAVASQPAPRLILVDRPGAPQSELRIGHIGLARATPDYAAAHLLETVLGGSFTSRLVQNLREKHGYTYGVRSNFLFDEAPGPFEVRTAVRTDVTAKAIEETVAELRAIRSPVRPEELQKGRALVRNSLVDGFGGGPEAAGLLADLLLHDLPLDSWSRLPAALDELTIDHLARTAERLFQPDRLTITVVGDLKQIEASLRALPFAKTIEYRDADGQVLPAKPATPAGKPAAR